MTARTRRAAAAIAVAGLLAAGYARAETRTIAGAALVLSTSLSDDLVIGTDASLHDQIRLTRAGGLSCLSIVGSGKVVISTSQCGEESGRLQIDVSPDMPLTLASSGDGNIRVGDMHGPLTVSLSGDGDLVAGRTGPLTLSVRASGDATLGEVDGPAVIDIDGNGDVRIKEIRGPLTEKQVGSGDLVVGTIEGGDAILAGSGSGDILLGGGHIQALNARMSGSGDLSVGADIRDADVAAHGGGDVKLGPVSGTLTQDASGGSDIVVLDASHARALDDQATRKLDTHAARTGTTRSVAFEMPAGLANLLTGAFVALVLYICWRIVRRAGGLPGLRRQLGARAAAAAPTNPGVLALGETMTRLEQRLGRLESYVTTREFDLARKFRELGPQ